MGFGDFVNRATADEAVKLVNGDRGEAYGDPTINLTRIAGLWSAFLGVPVNAHDVAQMMVLTKISRSRVGCRHDNYVDQVAYSLLAEQVCVSG